MRFAFIDEERFRYSIAKMCRVLGVSRQGYHAWSKRGPSKHEADDAKLAEAVCKLHAQHYSAYGAPKMTMLLRAEGIRTSKKRVARIMHGYGLRGAHGRKGPKTARPGRPLRDDAPDLVNRNFEAEGPNRLWYADITYVKTKQDWLYLAVVADMFSRMIVGWAMGPRIAAELADDALRMAIERRRPGKGLISHSDHGSQYRSLLLGRTMEEFGIRPSMGSVASPWDNSPAESIMSAVKKKCVHSRIFDTRESAQIEIFEYIEGFYNRLRLHSSLGYLSPAEFEAKMAARGDVA